MESFDRVFKAKLLAARALQDDGENILSFYLERASIYQVGMDFEIRAVPLRIENQEAAQLYRPSFTMTGEYVNMATVENVRDLLLHWARANMENSGSRDNTA